MRTNIIIEKPMPLINIGAADDVNEEQYPIPSFLRINQSVVKKHFEETIKPVSENHLILNTNTKEKSMSGKNKLTIYGCGGCGINIASIFEKTFGVPNAGFADIIPYYIDTSKSNIGIHIPKERTYLIEGLDGSGKIRRENHLAIGECIHDILLNHKPGDINIIISSTSGGSGNIISGSLLSELLSRNVPTIVIAVSSTDSSIEIDNTIKTLLSYESISKKTNVPVPVYYAENSSSTNRKDVNKEIYDFIVRLAILFSGENKELDSSDLRNWLNYTKATPYEAHLVGLESFSGTIDRNFTSSTGVVISVATLAKPDDNTSPGEIVEYQCVGFLPPEADNVHLDKPMHYAIIDGMFGDIKKKFDNLLNGQKEKRLANTRRNTMVVDGANTTDSGLVL